MHPGIATRDTLQGYAANLPDFAIQKGSLFFDAAACEAFKDYAANTLYFRDSKGERVAASFSRSSKAWRKTKGTTGWQEVAANVPRIHYTDGEWKLLMEPKRTNLFHNSGNPATKTVTVTDTVEYTVWIEGSGSITLTGAGTGTVTEGSPVTFTASGTSLTCTVSGSVDYAQVEAGGYATSWIETAGSSVTRMVENLERPATAMTFLEADINVLYANHASKDGWGLLSQGGSGSSYNKVSINIYTRLSGVNEIIVGEGIGNQTGNNKIAIRKNGTQYDAFQDGSKKAGNIVAGDMSWNSFYFSGIQSPYIEVRQIVEFDGKNLSDTDLQTLTS